MAKSTIMMAFFFTMPISRMIPMNQTRERSTPATISASRAPTPADGSGERIGDGMNQAFVKDAENDIHGDERGEQKQRCGGQ